MMREKDLTDREIAEKIRKTPSMIYHYRLLKSKCPQKTVNAIAGVLGVSAEIIATKHAHRREDKPPNAQGKEVWYWLGGLDSVMGTKGETDRSVASAVGRSATTIYCYRTLRAKCKECIAIKIADALGVSSEEIISECADGNKSSPQPENVVWCLLGGLDAMMTQRGIGTTELGRMVGRRPCTIHQYRNLNSKCQEKTAIRIADALGVFPEEIITAKTSCRFANPKPDAENKYNRDRNEWCLLGGLENVIEKKKAVVSELCRTTGIDRRSIQRYKALRTKCHTGTAAKIAAALGVSADEIITKYVDGKYTPWRKITKGGNV